MNDEERRAAEQQADAALQRVRLASGVELATNRPVLELADYRQRAEAAGWRFVCPKCGNVASPADFTAIGGDGRRAAAECIGRIDGAVVGCDWAAFGLLGTLNRGLLVRVEGGFVVESFDIAPP